MCRGRNCCMRNSTIGEGDSFYSCLKQLAKGSLNIVYIIDIIYRNYDFNE
jgi:hypothetical protein